MLFNAYYSDSKDAVALEGTLRDALASFWPDPFGFKLELAPVASVLVHLEVIRDSGRTVKDLAEILDKAQSEGCTLTINYKLDDDIFELQKSGEA